MKHYKPLLEIIPTDGEPNILEEMVDNNFRAYKVKMLKKKADPECVDIDIDDALIGVSWDGRLVYDKDIIFTTIKKERPDLDETELEQWLVDRFYRKNTGSKLDPLFISLNMELIFQTLK